MLGTPSGQARQPFRLVKTLGIRRDSSPFREYFVLIAKATI